MDDVGVDVGGIDDGVDDVGIDVEGVDDEVVDDADGLSLDAGLE
ncbi:MAG: hypothetical protein WAX04_10180 [Oscillospiraceae bacterium]